MKKKLTLLILTAAMFVALPQAINAQDQETPKQEKPKKDFKNTVHLNLTNIAIFGGRSFVIGYERVVKKHQTFTINVGTTALPSFNFVNTDSLDAQGAKENSGFNMSVDYRFYLAKENKYKAPHGVYIGPYYSYNYFNNKKGWQIKSTSGSTGSVSTDMKLNIHTIGAELGYQFVLWDRLALDFVVLGPGWAFYNLKTHLHSSFNLTDQDKEKLYNKLEEALGEKFPGWEQIISDDKEKEFQKKGNSDISSFGYRFMIQVGFRF